VQCSGTDAYFLGDYHQHLLKMRLQGGLEGVEMGPMLGRGSYGRVYKGDEEYLAEEQSALWLDRLQGCVPSVQYVLMRSLRLRYKAT
jgi:hypothetical protein